MLTTTPKNYDWAQSYNGAGQPRITIDPLTGQTEQTYNAAGQLTGVWDPNRHPVERYGYDESGRLALETGALERNESYHFLANFGTTATNYLTRSFPSNQGISDVSAAVVQVSPGQYRKAAQASDATTDDVIRIVEYARDEDVDRVLAERLAALAASGEAAPVSVFILARSNHQEPEGLRALQSRFAGRLRIEFRTARCSKGLEADWVVVLGMNLGAYGSQSQMEDDPRCR